MMARVPPGTTRCGHRYVFTLYALDVPRLEVHGTLTGENIKAALAGHILAETSLTGTYSLNPTV